MNTVRSTTLDPAPPPQEYVAVSGGMYRDCGVHDFDIVRFVTGQEAVEVYATGTNQGAEFFAEYDDADTSAAIVHLRRRHPRRRLQHPLQRPRLRRAGWRCTARRTASPPAWTRAGRCATSQPGVEFPSGPPHRFFMDRFLPAFRAEFDDVPRGRRRDSGRRRAPSPTRWRRTGSPRPATQSLQRAPSGAHRGGTDPMTEHRDHRVPDRRSADLLGRLRGARLGLPARARQGARRDARGRAGSPPNSDPTGSCPPSPTRWPTVLAQHGLQAVGGFTPVLLHEPGHDPVPEIERILEGYVAAERRDAGAVRGHRPGRLRQPPRARRRRLGDAAGQPGPDQPASPPSSGIRAVLHPHVGTMIENPRRGAAGAGAARRSRCAWTPGTC